MGNPNTFILAFLPIIETTKIEFHIQYNSQRMKRALICYLSDVSSLVNLNCQSVQNKVEINIMLIKYSLS